MTRAPWSSGAAAAIGVDALLAAIAPAGEFGRRRRAVEHAFLPGDERRAQAAIAAVATAARDAGAERLDALRAALARVPDPVPAARRAAAGDVLGDVDFFELNRFVDAVRDVRSLAESPSFASFALPDMDALAVALAPGATRQRTFYLADAFDASLAAARGDAAVAEARYAEVRGRQVARAAAALGVDSLREGEFTLLRDGLRLPLPPDVRVVREASTYVACELVLDEPGLTALADRDAAEMRVAAAEEAVRTRLSRVAGDVAASLERACEVLGELDLFVARARFAVASRGVVPEIPVEGGLSFVDARFLPLEDALSERGRSYVPISLRLDGVAVVTGPNMGGKTAALRTCGFIAACVALGVPVPAKSASVPLFDEIAWIGIARGTADEETPERRLLSSFGAEVGALRDFFERGASRALALVDEFARTTTPREGRALLVALLEKLRERGAVALAATHLHGVAREAGAAHFAIAGLRDVPQRPARPLSLGAALDLIGGAMDYRLLAGDEAESAGGDALALADVLGLDAGLVARARAELARVTT